ncbi:methyltransferase [Amycolatopsis minnesotensis]|uniref:Methyltransferase n=2 Tax=Amycolatopsis minnesotensis TaxID=337894 RepID=A0ABN2QJU3_9PSEU
MALNNAYFQSKIMQSAVELGVFELLADGPADAETLREKLGIQHRMYREYFGALVGVGLLEFDGERYRNSADADEFLVPDRAAYLGGTARQHAKLHYLAWGKLTEALRDGHAKSEVRPEGGTKAFTEYYEDLDRARRMMTHVDAHNGFMAEELAKHIDWRDVNTFVDVGGARGNLAARIVLAHPHLTAGVVDLPALEPLFDDLVRDLGVADKVRYHGGDFFESEWPVADLVVIGHVLPDWPDPERRKIVARCFETVRPGGTLVVYDALVDDQRDPDTLLRRINSTMIRDDHLPWSVSDCQELLAEFGFTVERLFISDTIAHDHVIVATKPG